MTREDDLFYRPTEESEPLPETEAEGPSESEAGAAVEEEEPPSTVERVIVYLDDAREWRWVALAGSDTVADSGEGYKRKSWAVRQARGVTGVEPEVKPYYRDYL